MKVIIGGGLVSGRPLSAFRIFVLSDAASAPVGYTLIDDGAFYWHLPPGPYTIAAFQLQLDVNSVRTGQIFARFTIPEEYSVVYLGTLTIRFSAGRYAMQIEDDYREALRDFTGKFEEMPGEVAKKLMHLEGPR